MKGSSTEAVLHGASGGGGLPSGTANRSALRQLVLWCPWIWGRGWRFAGYGVWELRMKGSRLVIKLWGRDSCPGLKLILHNSLCSYHLAGPSWHRRLGGSSSALAD